MKINNKGFAVTSIIYSMLVLFLALVLLIMSNLASRKTLFDKQKNEILGKLNGDMAGGVCTLIDSDGDNKISLSDVVTCANEKFNVISNDGVDITMLASKHITLNIEAPVQGGNDTILGTELVSNPYIEAYATYLQNNGVSSATASILTVDQVKTLGCDGDCAASTPLWLYKDQVNVWLWDQEDYESGFLTILTGGGFYTVEHSNAGTSYYLRPVVTMSIQEVKYSNKNNNPSCTIVIGDKNTDGSEVECGGERFYIIPQDTINHVADSTTISLLAKYNLNVGTWKVEVDDEGIQSENATGVFTEIDPDQPPIHPGGVGFSENANKAQEFWAGKVTEFPAYVYGEGSPTYEYVNDYKEYLEEKGVKNIKEATLISYKQADHIRNIYSNPSWLHNDQSYWTGTAYSSSDAAGNGWASAYYVTSSGITPNVANYPTGVRPIIVVSADEIQ